MPRDIERDRERQRAWRAANAEYLREHKHAYYLANRDRILARCRIYYRENAERCRASARQSARNTRRGMHGLTRPEALAILSAQGGRCACCGDPINVDGTNSWAVHHLHSTGTAHDVLCRDCNAAEGWLKSDWRRAQKLAQYMKRVDRREAVIASGQRQLGVLAS